MLVAVVVVGQQSEDLLDLAVVAKVGYHQVAQALQMVPLIPVVGAGEAIIQRPATVVQA
jgi:hypothetical protein